MSDDKNILWGGRFSSGPHPDMLRLTTSIGIDVELLEYDLLVTRAHARTLTAAGLLEADEVAAVDDACAAIADEWASGSIGPAPGDEDVHTAVERELTARLGEIGRRIHAGRSRNDLVATDLRLWCKSAAAGLRDSVAALCGVIADRAEEHSETVMPGFTHLQPAQPISAGFHLLAHGFSLARDAGRFEAARTAADVSALGAGALAGTTLPLDPAVAQAELGFSRSFDNAMDAVSDRDFAADLLYASALCGVHLSRLAEEIVLWTSPSFSFARLPDEWSTGSSMMPQKRNPDLAELIRGRTGAAIGDLTGFLALLKGLPLAYHRDLQEDKAILFPAVMRTEGAVEGMTALVRGLTFAPERLAAAAREGATWATDLAELLVARGVPFRDAHEIVGALVAGLEASGRAPDGATLAAAHPALQEEDAARLTPEAGMRARSTPGGTSPEEVVRGARALRETSAGLSS